MLRKRGVTATQSSVSRTCGTGRGQAGRSIRASDPQAPLKSDFSALKQFVHARLTAGTNLNRVENHRGLRPKRRPWPSTPRAGPKCGTLSGDDTIFIATAGAREQRQLSLRFAHFRTINP